MLQFTAQEKRILNILADGKPHDIDELLTCLDSPLRSYNAVRISITYIRKKLRPYNQFIHSIPTTSDSGPTQYVHLCPKVAAKPRSSATEPSK